MGNFIDLTGQRFGRLIAIKKVEKPSRLKGYGSYWLCKCECGNEKIISGKHLRERHTISCGCYNKEQIKIKKGKRNSKVVDLTGKRFGKLTVLERKENGTNYRAQWLCKCSYGNERIINSKYLLNGSIKSCGCYDKERKSLPSGEASKRKIYRVYKRIAKIRGFDFYITYEDFLKIVSKNCFYCDCKPSNIQKNKWGNGDFIYNGIDRIDNTKGYIDGNVVPCCYQCNHSKTDMSISDFYEWINRVNKNKKI